MKAADEIKTILVQKNTHGRIKFIELVLAYDTVSRVWGLVGGKTQTTSNTYDYINKGKANELNPLEAASADYDRIIETKMKEGYLPTKSLDDLPDFDNEQMDFENLPVQFCCSKPYISIPKTKLNKYIKNNSIRWFLKENGLCHFILITPSKEVKIYSRRIDDHTAKYPKIAKAFEALGLPANTLIAVELTIDGTDEFVLHMERYNRTQSISRSDTLKGKVKDNVDKTLVLQEETPIIAVMFNILYLDGFNRTTVDYNSTINIMTDMESYDTSGYIRTPRELSFDSYQEAYDWAFENLDMVEGLVIWVKEENAEITYNGKPSRRACYKFKAVREDDVIAYDWKEGTGAKQGKVGSVYIGKYNKELTEIVPMGRVGSGIKIKEGQCELDFWPFPCVIQISYDQRFPTGSYQFPRFDKKHEDKIPTDVVVDEEGF